MQGHRLVSDRDHSIRMRRIPSQLRIWSILSGNALGNWRGSQSKPKAKQLVLRQYAKLLDRGYGKAQQIVENDDDLSNKTADELRTEVLADIAKLFPDLRLVPAKPRNSLAELKVRQLSFDRPRDACDVD